MDVWRPTTASRLQTQNNFGMKVKPLFDYNYESKTAAETQDKYDFSSALKPCYGVDLYDIEEFLKMYGEEVEAAVEDLTDDELATYLRKNME